MNLSVYNLKNEKVKELEVLDSIFNAEVKPHVLHQVITGQLRLRRQGTAKVKNRSEIKGSTRKIYKQKGTGSARHGSKKAPIFRGGGTVFGPRGVIGKYKINKKVMKGGMISALSMLVNEGKIRVVESLELDTHKTKDFKAVLDGFDVAKGLVVSDYEADTKFYLATRNIKDMKVIKPEGLNVFDLLKYQNVIISVDAVKALEKRLG